MNFHAINFLIGTNRVVGYDAGMENNPTNAPDPVLQGWTVAPATGALTNAVSPDIGLLPAATTLAANQFTLSSAVVNGLANASGSPTTAWFEWGTDTNYGNVTTAQSVGQGTGNLGVNAPLAGLVGGPQYHYRIVATNAFGMVTGADLSFSLLGPTLSISASNLSVIISWQPDSSGFVLQETPNLFPAGWTNSPSFNTNPVVVSAAEAARFYRLVRTPPE